MGKGSSGRLGAQGLSLVPVLWESACLGALGTLLWVWGTPWDSGNAGEPGALLGALGWSHSFAAVTVSKSHLGSVPQFPFPVRIPDLSKGDLPTCKFAKHSEK